MTAPYTAADSSSVALAEEELAAIRGRDKVQEWEIPHSVHCASDRHALLAAHDRLVAELTWAREEQDAATKLMRLSDAMHRDAEDELRSVRKALHDLLAAYIAELHNAGRTGLVADPYVVQARAALGDDFAEATASKEEPADGP